MNQRERIMMIYAASMGGAGLVSYLRGRRGPDVVYDAMWQGALVGTVGVIGDMYLNEGSFALTNGEHDPHGTLSDEAIRVLDEVNPEVYEPMRSHGVKIADSPENLSIVNQDE